MCARLYVIACLLVLSLAADMWVAVAGPLTHVPMTAIWVLLLLPAYHASTGSWAINLVMPYPDGPHLWHAVCVGAIYVSRTNKHALAP